MTLRQKNGRPLCPKCRQTHTAGIRLGDCGVQQVFCECAVPRKITIFWGNAWQCNNCMLGIPGDPRRSGTAA